MRTLSYDGSGNPVTDAFGGTTFTYQFDSESRLVRALPSPVVAGLSEGQYAYDPFDRLISRTTVNGSVHYIYDQADHIIAEVDGSTAPQTLREYIWLDDQPIAVVSNVNTASPQLLYVHADHLNRPVMMTDQSRTKIWEASYKPFGEVQSVTGLNDKTQRFPGQWYQIETGLTYNWHRHYDGTIGRYLQADPLGLEALLSDGPSIYGYAGQSPLTNVDPLGRQTYTPIPLDPNGSGLQGYNYSNKLDNKIDLFHSYPFSYDSEVLKYGRITRINPLSSAGSACYFRFEAPGYVNG